ncbi:MAG: acyltransferase family protein [Alphaproteobacteria bacterium]
MNPEKRQPDHPAYRPDIDGLRAIAVLSVVLYHAFPAWVPGGFVGVDIFFVISGFLISSILLAQLQAGHFSIANFYARRVRRIFPALLVILVAALGFGFVVLWPGEYRHLATHAAGGAGFIVNYLLQRETGYFTEQAEVQPLLHLWSMGVEEQFYIFWPLMLAAAWKWKHHAGAMIVIVIAASFAANIWFAFHGHSAADFYSLFSRFWELMAGASLAWGMQHGLTSPHSRAAREGLAVLGMLLVVAADFALNKTMVFPGWLVLLPVSGAVLLIAAGKTTLINSKLMANPLAVGIGLISYPLYLWHWPLLSFAEILRGEYLPRGERMELVALAFVLATLTYKFIEQPIRKGALKTKPVFILLTLMVFTGGISLTIYAQNGLPVRFASLGDTVQALDDDRLKETWQTHVRYGACHLQAIDADMQAPECIETARPLLLLWGDSHAASLYPGLKKLQETHSFGIAQLTQSGCPPILDVPLLKFRPNCNAINRRILEQLPQLKPDLILLDSAWIHEDFPMEDNDIIDRLLKTIAQIKQTEPQAKIIVVGPVPRWLLTMPGIYRHALTFTHKMPPAYATKYRDTALATLDGEMREKLTAAGITYLDPQPYLCNDSGCLTRYGDNLAYIDREHITAPVAEMLAEKLAPDILDGLGLPH